MTEHTKPNPGHHADPAKAAKEQQTEQERLAAEEDAKKVAADRKESDKRGKHLIPAGESGDPAVHVLLAERQTLLTNQEALRVSLEQKAADKAADKRLEEIADELAKLGYK